VCTLTKHADLCDFNNSEKIHDYTMQIKLTDNYNGMFFLFTVLDTKSHVDKPSVHSNTLHMKMTKMTKIGA